MWKSGLDSLDHGCVCGPGVGSEIVLCPSFSLAWCMEYGFSLWVWDGLPLCSFWCIYISGKGYALQGVTSCIFHAQIPHAEFICKGSSFVSYIYIAISISIIPRPSQIHCESLIHIQYEPLFSSKNDASRVVPIDTIVPLHMRDDVGLNRNMCFGFIM